jgi:hypothetical protein
VYFETSLIEAKYANMDNTEAGNKYPNERQIMDPILKPTAKVVLG